MATTVESGTEVVEIVARPATAESFKPFGRLLTAEGNERLPIELYGSAVNVFRPAAIEADVPIEWLLVENSLRPFRAFWMERHMQIEQAFIPLIHPIVSIVARPDAELDNGVPAAHEMHAFVVPAGAGAQIYRGTWHEPPMPIVDKSWAFVTSHKALTQGLGADLGDRNEIGQLDVDKRDVTARTGKIYRIVMP
jgi:ureidoglycolate lyase